MMDIRNRIPAGPNRQPFNWNRTLAGAVRGGVLRHNVRDIDRGPGRDALMAEVKRRGYHLIECGDQFIIICNPGPLRVHI
ncbi:hypothetical protein [Aestuariibius sp. HNIBRBA575]|uniref:hypothetical protein n=1 Tax=Aestuariibius sp. HNIBRBA575 TaxID=3233343 RepID=UPI0034A49A31